MYENLKIEMMRKKISQREVATALGIHESTFFKKISSGRFSIEEVFIIKKFFPYHQFEYLFERSDLNIRSSVERSPSQASWG